MDIAWTKTLAPVCIMVLLAGCTPQQTNLQAAANPNTCNLMPPAPQPEWVSGQPDIAGYYVGVGSSSAGQNLADAEQAARDRALANLSSSIQTTVSQQLDIQIQEDSNHSDQTRRKVESHTRAITQNAIENSQRDGIWLDRQSCNLWLRIKVAEKDVKQIQHKNQNELRLALAKQAYSMAADATQNYNLRLDAIETALLHLNNVDFKVLPLENHEQLLNNYRKLQSQILSETSDHETLIITLAEQALPRSLHKDLGLHISRDLAHGKHIYPSPCKEKADCLAYARKMQAKQLILLNIQATSTAAEMGAVLAELTLDGALINVSTGMRISEFNKQKGQTLSFDPQHIAWDQAITRLFENNVAISQLQQAAKTCNKTKC